MKRHLGMSVFILLAVLVVTGPAAWADDGVVGKVVRLKNSAMAMQDAQPRPLQEGGDILIGDVISTGKGTRLEFSLKDGSVVTLGERTTFVVEAFSDTPAHENIAMRMLTGFFKAASGKVAEANPDAMNVATEVATIGIRGTTGWGGRIDGAFGVALLAGKAIRVTTRAGSVDLTTVGQGTTVTSATAPPSAPITWSAGKVARATATVNF